MAAMSTYRMSCFDCSSFSSDALTVREAVQFICFVAHPQLPKTLPPMDPKDTEQFLLSLKAQGIPDIVEAARFWEESLLPAYPGPFFSVRVADVRATLDAGAAALILYKEVKPGRAHFSFVFTNISRLKLR
jgi:hypothetical protein